MLLLKRERKLCAGPAHSLRQDPGACAMCEPQGSPCTIKRAPGRAPAVWRQRLRLYRVNCSLLHEREQRSRGMAGMPVFFVPLFHPAAYRGALRSG